MPHRIPGSLQERNQTIQAGRHRGNQGGRPEDDNGRQQWSGNGGGHDGMPGGDDRGEHDNFQSSPQQRGHGGGQGGTQSGVHSGIQQSSQNSSDGRQHGGGDRSGQGQGSRGPYSGRREEDGGRNNGEQNEPAGGRGRQNQDQRRYLKGNYHQHSLKKLKSKIYIFTDGNIDIIVDRVLLKIFNKTQAIAIKQVLQCITSAQGCDVKVSRTFPKSENFKLFFFLTIT